MQAWAGGQPLQLGEYGHLCDSDLNRSFKETKYYSHSYALEHLFRFFFFFFWLKLQIVFVSLV